MRKIWVISLREYNAAVRTKTFLIGLLIMPVLMGGSVLLQIVFRDVVDTTDKQFVLINRTKDEKIVDKIRAKIQERNKNKSPKYVVEYKKSDATWNQAEREKRFELSERVRDGELVGFLEILEPEKEQKGPRFLLRYQTNISTYGDFRNFIKSVASDYVRAKLELPPDKMATLLNPVALENKGLSKRDDAGKIRDASDQNPFASVIVPVALMMLMFMVVMMSATPQMQGVVEEKMQRIAEVLLGSVRPFQLMMGKLIGMTGVSLTVSAVYLAGAYWVAYQFGHSELLTWQILILFFVYQSLACLMFGSLFIAVGAACTDMKETQNLMWPVMLLVCIPLFMLATILKEPNSVVARGLSYFPFSSPSLMIVRQAIPPGVQWWEPVLAISLIVTTTVICVYAAGRIFRVGILMQGKGAKLHEMFRWVFRG